MTGNTNEQQIMKKNCPSQLSTTARTTYIEWIVLILLLIGNHPANAQGVIHLSAGDSYLFIQPTLVTGQIEEAGLRFITVSLGFSGDLFTLGDSLQMDVFSTPSSLTPLTTGIVINPPWTRTDLTSLHWVGQRWDAPSGALRVTMLSGSVDISSVDAITAYGFFEGFYAYAIPEPSVSLLLAPGLVYLLIRHRKVR